MLAVFALFMFPFLFTDIDSQTKFTGICFTVFLVAAWPITVCAFIFHVDPPPVVSLFLWIFSGLFWACLVELLFMTKKRIWPHKPLDKINSN
jgi:hypothetical protein